MTKTIQTTCPYCGVGCGILATVDETHRQLTITGDKNHPANFGRLCSKGSALGETVGLQGRLLNPKIDGQDCDWEQALSHVAEGFRRIIAQHGPDAVAFYASGQLLTEDYYVANKLMKGFIGSANIDTNSRLCMSSSVAGHKRAFGSDTVPGCYEDLEEAEMLVLVGSNAAWCHPVLFQRIRAAKIANPALKIVVIDPRKTSSCDIADLHLPLASGSDAWLFNGVLHYLQQQDLLNQDFIDQHCDGLSAALAAAANATVDSVARHCQLPVAAVRQFLHWFATHEKVVSLYSQGINQSSSGTDKVNAILNCHLATGRIGKPGMGPLSLTGQPNAMGGREVGGLANQLAAHMDFRKADDVDRVARFWGAEAMACQPGLPAVEMFDAIADGTVKAVWIMATNPVVSLPNADKVKRALQGCELVVVSDCIADTDTTALAHVLLPALGWSEKDGTVTNSERRISRQRALFAPAGNAKADWWIISQVAKRMGFGAAFDYQSPLEIFREHAALSGFENDCQHGLRDFDLSALADITSHAFDNMPAMQWPINCQHPGGRARLFADGAFFSADGKARLLAINPQAPTNPVSAKYPLILNTGRLRDQWHTMTRTALAARLNQHRPEVFVTVHPQAAERYALADQGLAKLESAWGSLLARVQISDEVPVGQVFVPMHWSDQFTGQGRVGALVNPVVDAYSKQPESKHTPVRIQPYQTAWHGFALSRQPLALDGLEYWCSSRGEGFYRYEWAGSQPVADWSAWFQARLTAAASVDNAAWLSYEDAASGHYRSARIVDDALDCVLFSARDQQLPDRGWLSSLFALETLDALQRKALLSGLPPAGDADVGAIVCACFNVGAKTIVKTIAEQGLKSVSEVSRCLKAGSNCGSCIPEIKALL